MEKSEYVKKSLSQMKKEKAKKMAEEITKAKAESGFKYTVDKEELAKQLKKWKASLGSPLAEKINFQGHQLSVRQKNKEKKGK